MITLSSDFGSPYPAAMKGVLLSRTDARLVDVAHDFPRQDVRSSAFWLREVLPTFPPAVHLVVVDPGVGTRREALVIRAGDHALVGPDNGVLVPVARALATSVSNDGNDRHEGNGNDDGDGDDEGNGDDDRDGNEGDGDNGANDGDDGDEFEVFTWRVDDPASHTFHGRDVFAPAAAAVHETGVGAIEALDRTERAREYVDLTFPDPAVGEREAIGEVLVVDGFGNVVTNLPGRVLDDLYGESIEVNGESIPVARTYAAVGPRKRLVTVGSHAFVELAVNRDRGDEAFDLSVGDRVELNW